MHKSVLYGTVEKNFGFAVVWKKNLWKSEKSKVGLLLLLLLLCDGLLLEISAPVSPRDQKICLSYAKWPTLGGLVKNTFLKSQVLGVKTGFFGFKGTKFYGFMKPTCMNIASYHEISS